MTLWASLREDFAPISSRSCGSCVISLIPHFRGRPLTPGRVFNAIRERLVLRNKPLNSCHGVYTTFDEAMRAASPYRPVGYDSADSAQWYLNKLDSLLLEDYPVVYWLRSAFETGSRSVFEIGGHIGEAYYGFQRVLPYPDDLSWTLCDVPTIAAAGRKLAAERGVTNLKFVTDTRHPDGADILLAAGALQYFEPKTLVDTLAAYRTRPRHILVNVTPVYDGPSFVTLQYIGSAYCAYRIFNRQEFVESLEAIGYRLVDAWRKERAFSIPGHPDKSFQHYSGFYFRHGE